MAKRRIIQIFRYVEGAKSVDLLLKRGWESLESRVPETVVVAQLVEPLIVVQVVAGSSPVGRPTSAPPVPLIDRSQ